MLYGRLPMTSQRSAPFAGERREIQLERVGFVHCESRMAGELPAQQGCQVAIDFYYVEGSQFRAEKALGECAASGADLDQPVPWLWTHGRSQSGQ